MGMLFELLADLRRWKSDKKINKHDVLCTKLDRDLSILVDFHKTSQELQVGDLIWIKNKEVIPADCLILATNDPSGKCYINTATLDGERNLKLKQAPEASK